MKRIFLISFILFLAVCVEGQRIKEFAADTATFVSELRIFNATDLNSEEAPDFERFVNVWDSLPYERQMEIIDISNLMLNRSCRPRPHFILFHRVIIL